MPSPRRVSALATCLATAFTCVVQVGPASADDGLSITTNDGLAAAAIGGNCEARREKKVQSFRADAYRVVARCTSLNANTKARGVLPIAAEPDTHTAWFTVLYTDQYSSWTTATSFTVGTARPELNPV